MKNVELIRSSKALVLGTTLVLLALVGYVVYSLVHNNSAAKRHLEQELARTEQLARVRIASSVHELEQVLRVEGIWLAEWATMPSTDACIERWRPLLESEWAWSKIGIADEFGNEIALQLSGDSLLVRNTTEGSQETPAEVRLLSATRDTSAEAQLLRTEMNDPRSRLWFSKALEDARDAPIWTILRNEVDGLTRLQLSLLLRPSNSEAPFRVVVVEADPERVSWLSTQDGSGRGEGMLVLNSEGTILNSDEGMTAPQLRATLETAARLWKRDRPKGPFHITHNEHGFLASFSPFALNGQTLYSGVVLAADPADPVAEDRRYLLTTIAVLLLLLCVLLGTLWWRSLVADAEVRKKERRSRSQELRLAKALGEREVLNREVHHRVKNNLQVVSSLLNLQASGMDNEAVRSEFLRGKRRIDTIALVHHKLYALKDFRNVDIDLFFGALTQATAESNLPQSRTVSFEVATQGLKCDQDTAIGLGIILCELMTNAFQHAFPYATGGHIEVLVQAVEGDLYRLVVKDNGKGLDLSSSAGNGKLGLEIVDALSDQLDGSFHKPTDGGNTFEVLFRMRTSRGSAESVGSDTNGGEEASAGL